MPRKIWLLKDMFAGVRIKKCINKKKVCNGSDRMFASRSTDGEIWNKYRKCMLEPADEECG